MCLHLQLNNTVLSSAKLDCCHRIWLQSALDLAQAWGNGIPVLYSSLIVIGESIMLCA